MMLIHGQHLFQEVPPGEVPNYNDNNPLLRVMTLIETAELAAERQHYLTDTVQYLFPFDDLVLYGPSAPNTKVSDPALQDDKNDFQKQNIADFHTTDTHIIRGLVTAGNWTGPFLRLSYRGGPDSRLSKASGHQLGDRILVWMRIHASGAPVIFSVPYNERSDRYEIELWGSGDSNLRSSLGTKGQAAWDRGEILLRPDLISGNPAAFDRELVANRDMRTVAPESTLHPILPLHLEVAWTTTLQDVWDSQAGANYHYEFNMIQRGWDQYLQVGVSPNPHGGFGFLEFRNLLSNYFGFRGSMELGRTLEPWNLNAFSQKVMSGQQSEEFMAVEYMDLHILKPECGIGLHRHRDNQEVFLMMGGRGMMVVGDWAKMDTRERCFEARVLKSGSLAMLKGGNLHGLMNTTDEDCSLFMFGGYD